MKRKKILLCLLAVLVCLCAFIGVEKAIVRHIDKINTTDKEIINISPDSVTEVSWTNEGKTLSFSKNKDEGVWQDRTDMEFPVSQEKFKTFLEKFESVHASFIIEDVKDYSQYGLDHPAASMEIVCGEETQKINFGVFSTMDAKRYVKTEDGTVYLIDDDLVKYLSPNKDDFMAHDKIYNYSVIKDVSIQVKELEANNSTMLDIQYLPDERHSYDDTVKYYLVDGTEYRPVDDKRMNNWLHKLTDAALTSYATYTATDADLKNYGMDRPSLVITVHGQMEEAADEEKVPESYKVSISKHGGKGHYLRVGNSKIIYEIDQSLYDGLVGVTYNTIRPTKIVNPDWEKVSALLVETGENAYDITQVKTDVYHLDEKPIEMSSIIEKINALSVSDFEMKDMSDQINNTLEKKPELALTIKLNMKDYPELKIDFYSLNGTHSLAQLNGETLGLVKRDDISGLREAMIRAALE